jgi:broad specificity phosphatase PhoE
MKVILIRHGDAIGTKGKFHGLVDNPLTESGKKEASLTAKKLQGLRIKKIISSPMTRARQTAKIVGDELGLPVEINKALNPLDLGDFVGKSVDTNLDKVKQYLSNPDKRIPGGGTVSDWANNYIPFINKLLYNPSDDTVAVVTHGRNIILTKADMKTGNNDNYDVNELLNADKSTEHGGYAVADGRDNSFKIVTPQNVKSGQS